MSITKQPTPQRRKSACIGEFTGSGQLKVEASYHPDPDIAAIVSLTVRCAQLSFQHTMNPEQARDMARRLIELADFADELTKEAAELTAAQEVAE